MIRLLGYFFQHPTLGMLGLLLSLGLGVFSLDRLQVQLMPDYRVDYATVTAELPGVSVVGMDEKVAKHLDKVLNAITGVAKVYTTSSEGYVNHYLELDDQSDVAATLDRIEQQIANIPELPSEMDPPKLNRFDASERMGRMIVYGPIQPEALPALRELISKVLRDNDVNRYNIYGGHTRRVLVEVDPAKADDLGISLLQIEQRLAQELGAPGSFSVYAAGAKPIVVRNRFDGFAGLESIDLGTAWNGIKLGDVATLQPNPKPRLTRNVFPNGDGVFVEFRRGPEQNIIQLTHAIEAASHALRAQLPGTVTVELYGMEAYQIRDRIQLLAKNGLMGLLFVVLVLYVFVGLRTAFWVGIGLPSAFALSFVFMDLSGQSINMVSVFTMVMVVGILVDDSIVVAEGVISNKTTLDGVSRTWSPVLTATLTTVAAFAPIMLLTDQIGSYVGAIPLFVCAALMASLIECFVLLPNHMHHDGLTRRLPDLPGRQMFGRLYGWFLAHPFRLFLGGIGRVPTFTLTTSIVLLIGVGAIMATGGVRFQFWLNPQSNYVFAHVTLASQDDTELLETTFAKIWVAADLASEQLSADGESVIQTTFAIVGRHYARRGADGQGEKGSILVELKDQGGDRIEPRDFLKAWQALLPAPTPGVTVEIEEQLQGLEGPPVSVTLRGETLSDLRGASQALVAALNDTAGLRDVRSNLAGRSAEFIYGISPVHKLLGLETSNVQSSVLEALNGRFGEQALATGEHVKWQVRYRVDGGVGETLDAVPVSVGSAARLSDVVDASFERSMTQIRRRDGEISVEVTAYHDAGTLSLSEARAHITDTIMPRVSADFDVEFDQGGHIRTQDKTMQQIAMAFGLGLGLIYTVLSLTMRSFTTPLLIMGILPFGAAGMILGHFVLDYTLTLLSIVALVGLFGVLVNDSILLFDEIQNRRKTTSDWTGAVHEGYSHRLRAVLLTSITTILGLLPLLLETSYQAQFLVPIAITISFGLGVSTLASFFLVPAVVSTGPRASGL